MSPARDPRPVSRTHERAVLAQDNGELAEDVVAKPVLDRVDERVDAQDDRHASPDGGVDEGDEVDVLGKDSFPASDAPPTWGGGPSHQSPSHQSPSHQKGSPQVRPRVVERAEVEHPPERARPDDPLPKSLPRDPA